MAERSFNVVFEGKGDGKGNHKGIRTWTTFPDAQALEDFFTRTGNSDRVIARGVSDEEAIELTRQTTTQSYVNSALQEATRPNGEINQPILEMKLESLEILRPQQTRRHRLGN